MNTQQITRNSVNSFTISVKPAPIVIRFVLMTLLFISITGPLLGLILSAQSKEGIKFGNILVLIIFGIIATYLLKMLLWNSFGSETFKINDNKIEYEADYKWFKDGKKILDLETTEVIIVDMEDHKHGKLILKDHENQINSAIKVKIEEIKKFANDFLSTNNG